MNWDARAGSGPFFVAKPVPLPGHPEGDAPPAQDKGPHLKAAVWLEMTCTAHEGNLQPVSHHKVRLSTMASAQSARAPGRRPSCKSAQSVDLFCCRYKCEHRDRHSTPCMAICGHVILRLIREPEGARQGSMPAPVLPSCASVPGAQFAPP